MEFDRERFEAGFMAEADELLLMLAQGLAALRSTQGGGPLLGDMARAAHTLRGSSTMMGYAAAAGMARLMELFLDRAWTGGMAMGDAQLDLLSECLQSFRASLDRGAGAPGRADELSERAEKLFAAGAP
ncbi:MAG: Hpt domain-containing protein [Chlamydiota bacterium]